MRIQCPRCKSSSSLPDAQEGAKVRCGSCGRVYVAHPAGTRGARARQGPPVAVVVGVALVVALLGIYLLVGRGGEGARDAAAAQSTTTRAEPEPPVDALDWESPAVQAAVAIHAAVEADDRRALETLLYGAGIWAREQALEHDARPDPDRFLVLPAQERRAHYDRWIASLSDEEGRTFVAGWSPYDGSVTELSDEGARVLLKVSAPEGGQRWAEWQMVRDLGRWKAVAWQRLQTPDERRLAELEARRKEVRKVQLSDGSVVYEREPEPLEHLEDTSPELRDTIDRLYATMIDLDLTKEASEAQHRLVEIGKPALPILLTGLYEIPLEDLDDAIQVNLIVGALRSITGRYMGFEPQTLVGAGLGTSEERRQSAIKQWFAWWYHHGESFTEKRAQEDVLEDMIELSEREKRWLEREERRNK